MRNDPAGSHRGTGEGDIMFRVQEVLNDVHFPANRVNIIGTLEDSGVEEDVMILFQSIPDREYDSSYDVSRELMRRGR